MEGAAGPAQGRCLEWDFSARSATQCIIAFEAPSSSIGTGGLKATSVTEALKCSGVRVGESASPDLFVPWGGSESRTVYTRWLYIYIYTMYQYD